MHIHVSQVSSSQMNPAGNQIRWHTKLQWVLAERVCRVTRDICPIGSCYTAAAADCSWVYIYVASRPTKYNLVSAQQETIELSGVTGGAIPALVALVSDGTDAQKEI